MRRWVAATFGLGLSASAALGQTTAARPAVRVAAVRPLEDAAPAPAARLTARSQMGGVPVPPAMFGQPPAGGTPAPMGGGLPMPRPFDGPSVTTTPPASAPAAGVPVPTGSYILPGSPTVIPGPVIGGPTPDGGLFPCPNIDPPQFGGYASAPAAVGVVPAAVAGGGGAWWVSGEYLGWWTKSAQFPVLLTTSSPQFNGILGNGDTRVLFGNGPFGQTLHGGGRFGVGRWFGCDQCWGVDGNVFFLGRNGDTYRVNSFDAPVIARPFFNLNQNVPFSELVASPGLATGVAAVTYENSVWGAEANVRRRLAGTACARLDLLAGFRFLNVDEQLRITEQFARTGTSNTAIGVPNAVSGTVFDFFRTENQFYGGQVGLQGEVRRGRWYANLAGKVALGTVFQTAVIDGGQSILLSDGTTTNARGGLLAVPNANIGTYKTNQFAVVPEVGLQLGYHLTRNMRVFVGYNFLYLSSVLRPADQIDPALDVARVPNFPVPGAALLAEPRPRVPLKQTDFFAQGISFGLQFTW
jgi:hypothetical protein